MPSIPAAIVFMHGLDGSPDDWRESANWIAGKISRSCTVVCPAAPVQPITKNNGERMPAWFDVFAAWPYTPGFRDDTDGIARSVKAVHAEIEKLIANGVPSERIVVAGFSQGAVMAFASVYTSPKKLGGCVMLSGWVPNLKEASIAGANVTTPLFWGHGIKDEIVTIENQTVGAEALVGMKANVTAKQYDVGHDATEEEMNDLLRFVEESLKIHKS